LPLTIRARVELLRDLVNGDDPTAAADRRADATGLQALRLWVSARRPHVSEPADCTDDILELMRCCQAAEEDVAVLAAVCARLRERLRAAGVAFFLFDRGEPASVAGNGVHIGVASARRVYAAAQLVLPHHGGERVEGGVPVRYAGQVVGLLLAAWTPGAAWQAADVSVLLSAGATAAGPALSGVAARRVADRGSRTSELLGVSAAVAAVRTAIDKAACAPFAVLVEGESGSGKELVARLLHKLGPRADRAFCTLNCAALPDELIESELFGHARGAFTGAMGERRGVFEDAHHGTLFLDEVGELSQRAQAKLLRAIQEGEIRRVGENVCRRVDVRLVTATNRDLRVEVGAGRFRLDLLYRLDVIRIALPPLRARRDDIGVLAEHFWREATSRVNSRATLSASTLAALARHDWPGNIRELQNVLASLAVRSPMRGIVLPSALPPEFAQPAVEHSLCLEVARRTFDRTFISAALARAGGRRTRAAEELGLSRQGLAKLIARLDLGEEAAADAS
jgi:DNA-binding NtrC family response regulator